MGARMSLSSNLLRKSEKCWGDYNKRDRGAEEIRVCFADLDLQLS